MGWRSVSAFFIGTILPWQVLASRHSQQQVAAVEATDAIEADAQSFAADEMPSLMSEDPCEAQFKPKMQKYLLRNGDDCIFKNRAAVGSWKVVSEDAKVREGLRWYNIYDETHWRWKGKSDYRQNQPDAETWHVNNFQIIIELGKSRTSRVRHKVHSSVKSVKHIIQCVPYRVYVNPKIAQKFQNFSSELPGDDAFWREHGMVCTGNVTYIKHHKRPTTRPDSTITGVHIAIGGTSPEDMMLYAKEIWYHKKPPETPWMLLSRHMDRAQHHWSTAEYVVNPKDVMPMIGGPA
eukprot:gnl/TRDRNA2_/TRDRNA2_197401_c0_seq1.p1 gnl/TRDRNA2_/TRDRNA2_197401_c0~~gnl/TRDRNA2_/TRDRNA2_197401_c0_seq1.p1  ORF type:complete len:292 (-),score=37.52 gnl/TRDRNA2_/TRDRNA2_197401_c0_seq1:156-1031(-)